MQNKFRIVLADDHELLLHGISRLLKEVPTLEVVAQARNGFEAMDCIKKHRPHLAILDLNIPGQDGLNCLQKIKQNYPEVKTLVLTSYNQPELVAEVKRLGSDGFLVKNSTSLELKATIEKILSGETCYPENQQLKTIENESIFFDDFLKKYQLTKREVSIIRLVCQEMTSKQIADMLYLSELTINTHRRNILRKLEIKNIVALINFAKQNQLV
jgi:DNA-binding NarL/FixJ family response regulator